MVAAIGNLELETLFDAAFAEARRTAPGVPFRLEAKGTFPAIEAGAGWALATASVGLGLALRPRSVRIVVRADPAASAATLEVLAEGVAQEAPTTTEEWRAIERSIAAVEKLDSTFECRWLADEQSYSFRITVPFRTLRAVRPLFE